MTINWPVHITDWVCRAGRTSLLGKTPAHKDVVLQVSHWGRAGDKSSKVKKNSLGFFTWMCENWTGICVIIRSSKKTNLGGASHLRTNFTTNFTSTFYQQVYKLEYEIVSANNCDKLAMTTPEFSVKVTFHDFFLPEYIIWLQVFTVFILFDLNKAKCSASLGEFKFPNSTWRRGRDNESDFTLMLIITVGIFPNRKSNNITIL